MRDLILMTMLFGLAGISLRLPIVGVLAWAWITLMNPHQLGWGIVNTMPVNVIIVVTTTLGWLLAQKEHRIPTDAYTWLCVLFMGWITLCTVESLAPDIAWTHWGRSFKAIFFVPFVTGLMITRTRILGTLWVTVMAIGYFGVKGGLFVLASGGNHIVFGPPSSMITDRNHLALALTMIIPLLWFLRQHAAHRLVRHGLLAAMVLCTVSVVGSYSRGGFIAILGMFLFLALKSRQKILTTLIVVVATTGVVMFLPSQWEERIETIGNAQEDSSFQGRVDAWIFAYRAALDRPVLGAGMGATESKDVFIRYAGDTGTGRSDMGRAAHSIYFQVLGDQGFVGLGIFLLIALLNWWNAHRLIKDTRGRPEFLWMHDFGRMAQVSMVGFFIGGAALSMAYFSAFYVLGALLAMCRRLLAQEKKGWATSPTYLQRRGMASAAAGAA